MAIRVVTNFTNQHKLTNQVDTCLQILKRKTSGREIEGVCWSCGWEGVGLICYQFDQLAANKSQLIHQSSDSAAL